MGAAAAIFMAGFVVGAYVVIIIVEVQDRYFIDKDRK